MSEFFEFKKRVIDLKMHQRSVDNNCNYRRSGAVILNNLVWWHRLRAACLVTAMFAAYPSDESLAAETCSLFQFAAARVFPAGTNPVSAVVVDFNQDGNPDVAVASQEGTATDSNGNVWVLLGIGDGSFRTSAPFHLEFRPSCLASADFNHDGKFDLVVASMSTSGVSVLLGTGDGRFQESVEYAYGGQPKTVACGDLNLDGNCDVVLANFGTNIVSILLGNRDGTLQAARNLALGEQPQSIVIGDFNKDGKPDLAVSTTSESLFIFLGNGDGTFQSQIDNTPGAPFESACFWLAAGDFNRDGNVDLIGSWNNVVFLQGRGDGTFEPKQVASLSSSHVPVAIGDFDGDGQLDMAGAEDRVYLAYGNGDGTFQEWGDSFLIGPGPSSLFVGDFNRDGKLDLGATDYGNLGPYWPDGNVSILLGGGAGSFQGTQMIDLGGGPIAVGDLNGDGKLDVVGRGLFITMGNGDGTFQTGAPWRFPNGPIGLGDFNRDGLLDLAIADQQSTNIAFWNGKGDGSFIWPPQSQSVGSEPIALAIRDLNQDGAPDVAVANHSSGSVSVLLNKGDGTFNEPIDHTVGAFPTSIAIGDVNGDDYPDILTTHPWGVSVFPASVSVLMGLGDGSFSVATNVTAGACPYALALGDLNHDGNLDMVAANSSGSFPSDKDSVTVVLGNGDGTFKAPVEYFAGATPYSLVIDDFNGDEISDIAVANYASADISILLGKGDGTFEPPASFFSGSNAVFYENVSPLSLSAGDFNRDGKLDLILGNTESNRKGAVLLNTCAPRSPALNAMRLGNAFLLSWPSGSPSYILQSTTTLNPANWETVAQSPYTNASQQMEIMLPITGVGLYFRLRRQ